MDWDSTTKDQKRKDAFHIFYESVLKPDHELRQDAHEQKCYNELLEWRSEVIAYLDGRRVEEFYWRGVAQFGSALALGARCRRFKSCLPDPQIIEDY